MKPEGSLKVVSQNPVLMPALFQGFVNYLDEDMNRTKVKFVENKKLKERADTLESKSHNSFTH